MTSSATRSLPVRDGGRSERSGRSTARDAARCHHRGEAIGENAQTFQTSSRFAAQHLTPCEGGQHRGSSPGEHGERPGHFLDELRATFANGANRPAMIQQDRSWTYGEIETKSAPMRRELRQLGVIPGDRVAVVTTEKRSFLAAHLGFYAGAVALPLTRVSRATSSVTSWRTAGRLLSSPARRGPIVEPLRPSARAPRRGLRRRGGGAP